MLPASGGRKPPDGNNQGAYAPARQAVSFAVLDVVARSHLLIGIGGSLAAPPLPHHRAYGSVPRRFDQIMPSRNQPSEEGRPSRSTRYAAPVGPPDDRTCAMPLWGSRRQPPTQTQEHRNGVAEQSDFAQSATAATGTCAV